MIFVVLPAWNEERVIGPMIAAVNHALAGGEPYRIVLVDDGSTDRTRAFAERAAAEGAPLEIVAHPVNRGLGAALASGLGAALSHAADDDVIVTLDADLTQPPAMIPALVQAARGGHDLAIASRYRPGAVVRGVPAARRALSDLGRLVFQALFPIPGVRDYTCCFRAYRVPILKRARLAYGDRLAEARGFEAVMDLLLKLRPLGVRAVEVPLELDYGARAGQSKMKVLRTVRTTLALLARRFVQRFGAHSRRAVAARIQAAERRERDSRAAMGAPEPGP